MRRVWPAFSFRRKFPVKTQGIVFIPDFGYIEAVGEDLGQYLVRYSEDGIHVPFSEAVVLVGLRRSLICLSAGQNFPSSDTITLMVRFSSLMFWFAHDSFVTSLDVNKHDGSWIQRDDAITLPAEPYSTIIAGPKSLAFGQIHSPSRVTDLKGFGSRPGEGVCPANCRFVAMDDFYLTFAEGFLSFWDIDGNRTEIVELVCPVGEWVKRSVAGMTISETARPRRLYIPNENNWFAFDLE